MQNPEPINRDMTKPTTLVHVEVGAHVTSRPVQRVSFSITGYAGYVCVSNCRPPFFLLASYAHLGRPRERE